MKKSKLTSHSHVFHNFGPMERTVLGTLRERQQGHPHLPPEEKMTVAYAHHPGSRTHEDDLNFTVCMVQINPDQMLVASCKRNPDDCLNLRLGEKIAFHRALTDGCWIECHA